MATVNRILALLESGKANLISAQQGDFTDHLSPVPRAGVDFFDSGGYNFNSEQVRQEAFQTAITGTNSSINFFRYIDLQTDDGGNPGAGDYAELEYSIESPTDLSNDTSWENGRVLFIDVSKDGYGESSGLSDSTASIGVGRVGTEGGGPGFGVEFRDTDDNNFDLNIIGNFNNGFIRETIEPGYGFPAGILKVVYDPDNLVIKVWEIDATGPIELGEYNLSDTFFGYEQYMMFANNTSNGTLGGSFSIGEFRSYKLPSDVPAKRFYE